MTLRGTIHVLVRSGLLVLLVGCTLASPGSYAQGAGPEPNEVDVDAIFAEFDRPDSPGCAVGVYRAGEIVFVKGYGMANLEHGVPITPTTVFDIASNSKQFAAFAILLLERQGKLSLDDAVRRYVPELPDFGTPITVRHLMHNVSGLRDFGDLREMVGMGIEHPIDKHQFMVMLARQQALNFPPGKRYLYSNTNWVLLALIAERVDGRSYRKLMEQEVFEPLGMHHTQVRDDPMRVVPNRASTYTPLATGGYRINYAWGLASGLAGMSFVHTTVEDLARWDANFFTERVGGEGITERMYARGRLSSGAPNFYAAGLMVGQYRGLRTVYHGGYGGGSSQLIRFPDQRLSVAVLCNQYYTHTDSHGLSLRVAELYLGDVLAPEPSREVLPVEEIERYAGLYWIEEEMRRALFVVRDSVLLEVSEGEAYALEALGDGRFQDEYELIVFSPDGMQGEGTRRATGERYGLVRLQEWHPTPADLAEYEGTYYSDELDYVWDFAVADGELVLRREGVADLRLEPVYEDAFIAQNRRVAFRRGPAGMITHLFVSTDRVLDLKLIRG